MQHSPMLSVYRGFIRGSSSLDRECFEFMYGQDLGIQEKQGSSGGVTLITITVDKASNQRRRLVLQ